MFEWSEKAIEEAKGDFRKFVYIVWKSITLPHPTEVQYAMAHDLQDPPSDRMILEGFRGVAKSFLTCALCVWLLWRDPVIKVQMVSASGGKASLNAAFIKKIIMIIPFLECLRLTDTDRRSGLRDTNDLFDVHGAVPDISPSVKSVGITGQITGSRADVLIADDELASSLNPLNSVELPQGQYRAKPLFRGTCNDYYVHLSRWKRWARLSSKI